MRQRGRFGIFIDLDNFACYIPVRLFSVRCFREGSWVISATSRQCFALRMSRAHLRTIKANLALRCSSITTISMLVSCARVAIFISSKPRGQAEFEAAEHLDACFETQDAQALASGFASAGASLSVPLRSQPYGQEFYVRDPDGYILGFVQPAQRPNT